MLLIFIMCICAPSLSHVWLFVTPWTVARQAPLSMGLSRKEYWSGLPFPSPEDLLDQWLNPHILHRQVDFFPLCLLGSSLSLQLVSPRFHKAFNVFIWHIMWGMIWFLDNTEVSLGKYLLNCSYSYFNLLKLCVLSHSVMSNSLRPMDCSPQGFFVQGILQARTLEWVVMPSSRGSSWPRNGTHISQVFCIHKQVLYH